MKKKVFIGILAALMLFAFTACEGGTNDVYITGAAVEESDVIYLPGEKMNPADYQFSIVMFNGESRPAEASDFVFDDLTVPSKDGYIVGKYLGNTAWKVSVPVKVGTVNKITVSAGDDVKKDYYTATATAGNEYKNDSIKLDNLVIEADYSYKGTTGKLPVSVENKNISASIDDWTTIGTKKVVVKYTVDGTVCGEDDFDVDMDINRIQKVELKTTDNYVVFTNLAGGTTNQELAYSDENGFYMEATYLNGETATVDDADVKFKDDAGEYTLAFNDIKASASTYASDLAAKYDGKEAMEGLVFITSPIDITLEKDSVVDFTVTDITKVQKKDFTEDGTVSTPAINTIFGGTVKVTPVFKSKTDGSSIELVYNGSGADAAKRYNLTGPAPLYDFSGYTVGQRIEVELTGYVPGISDPFVKKVPVTVVAETV